MASRSSFLRLGEMVDFAVGEPRAEAACSGRSEPAEPVAALTHEKVVAEACHSCGADFYVDEEPDSHLGVRHQLHRPDTHHAWVVDLSEQRVTVTEREAQRVLRCP